MTGQFFYRDPDQRETVIGPLSDSQLMEAAAAGRLQPNFEISEDGQTWFDAGQLKPLLFPDAQADESEFELDTGSPPPIPAAPPTQPPAGPPALPPQQTDNVQQQDPPPVPISEPSKSAGGHRAWQRSRQFLIRFWQSIRNLVRFYWSQRKALWQYTVDLIPFLQEHGSRRNIPISRSSTSGHACFDGENWQVDLPDCCAVCGEPAESRPIEETRQVADLVWPFWAPIAGILVGFFLGLMLSSWLTLFALLAGIGFGYAGRGEQTLLLTFRRCHRHEDRSGLPTARLFRGSLIVGIGHRSVLRQFRELRKMKELSNWSPPAPPAAEEPTETATPARMPLAGSDSSGSGSAAGIVRKDSGSDELPLVPAPPRSTIPLAWDDPKENSAPSMDDDSPT